MVQLAPCFAKREVLIREAVIAKALRPDDHVILYNLALTAQKPQCRGRQRNTVAAKSNESKGEQPELRCTPTRILEEAGHVRVPIRWICGHTVEDVQGHPRQVYVKNADHNDCRGYEHWQMAVELSLFLCSHAAAFIEVHGRVDGEERNEGDNRKDLNECPSAQSINASGHFPRQIALPCPFLLVMILDRLCCTLGCSEIEV